MWRPQMDGQWDLPPEFRDKTKQDTRGRDPLSQSGNMGCVLSPPCRNPIFISPSFHLQWYPMRALQDGTAAYLGWGTANQPVCPIFSCFRYVPCVRPPTGRKLTGRRDGPFRASAGRCQPATFHLPLKAQVSSILPCLYRKVQVTDHPLSQWPPSLPFVCIYTLCY